MTGPVAGPKLLVTGFGPFPGAPENPTEFLVRAIAGGPAEVFGARALRAVVLPVDYRKSWPALRRINARFGPDVIVHFGLSREAKGLAVERFGGRRVDADRPDAAGFAPRSGLARRAGPDRLAATLPVERIVGALEGAGFPAAVSDDAGGYVCDATLYRSLHAALGTRRLVGFVHVPPERRHGYTRERLGEAAGLVLASAAAAWSEAALPAARPRVNAL